MATDIIQSGTEATGAWPVPGAATAALPCDQPLEAALLSRLGSGSLATDSFHVSANFSISCTAPTSTALSVQLPALRLSVLTGSVTVPLYGPDAAPVNAARFADGTFASLRVLLLPAAEAAVFLARGAGALPLSGAPAFSQSTLDANATFELLAPPSTALVALLGGPRDDSPAAPFILLAAPISFTTNATAARPITLPPVVTSPFLCDGAANVDDADTELSVPRPPQDSAAAPFFLRSAPSCQWLFKLADAATGVNATVDVSGLAPGTTVGVYRDSPGGERVCAVTVAAEAPGVDYVGSSLERRITACSWLPNAAVGSRYVVELNASTATQTVEGGFLMHIRAAVPIRNTRKGASNVLIWLGTAIGAHGFAGGLAMLWWRSQRRRARHTSGDTWIAAALRAADRVGPIHFFV